MICIHYLADLHLSKTQFLHILKNQLMDTIFYLITIWKKVFTLFFKNQFNFKFVIVIIQTQMKRDLVKALNPIEKRANAKIVDMNGRYFLIGMIFKDN